MRSAKLIELWQMDESLRALRAEPMTQGLRVQMTALAVERQVLSDLLTEMGCDVWCFHPKFDNSWLCVQRQRVVTDG